MLFEKSLSVSMRFGVFQAFVAHVRMNFSNVLVDVFWATNICVISAFITYQIIIILKDTFFHLQMLDRLKKNWRQKFSWVVSMIYDQLMVITH